MLRRLLARIVGARVDKVAIARNPSAQSLESDGSPVADAKLFAQLSELRNMDSVTGACNRNGLHSLIRDQGDKSTFMVIVPVGYEGVAIGLDVEHNHSLLRTLADRIANACQESGTVARLTGAKFAVALNSKGSLESRDQILDRVFRDPIEVGAAAIRLNGCAGYALVEPESDLFDVERQANIALDLAIRVGPGTIRQYDEQLHRKASQSQLLLTDIHRAMKEDEFRVLYQPIYDLTTRRCCGVEALIRWERPGVGLVGPDLIIPYAENSGLIVDLGLWVLRTAISDVLVHVGTERLNRNFTLHVNISARQLVQSDFVTSVCQVVDEYQFPRRCLTLELTESMNVDGDHVARDHLQALREQGIGLALDDFGVGFSSLAYLNQLRFDCLKIDRSFVSALSDQPIESRAIIQAIVHLAAATGASCVAEGVEYPEDCEVLLQVGCLLAQGWHFAKPMRIDGIAALLEAESQASQRLETEFSQS